MVDIVKDILVDKVKTKTFKDILADIETNQKNLIYLVNEPSLSSDDIICQIENTNNLAVISSAEGKLSTVENRENIKDWGKNNAGFPFHLDGGYYSEVPKFVILYCVRPSLKGGNTFFASGEKVIKKLMEKYDQNLIDSLNIIYISPDRKKYRHPLIKKSTQGFQLNWYSSLYIEPDINKITDNNRRLFTQYTKEIISDIEKYLEESYVKNHKWNAGDLVLFDNQLLLHGREEIQESGGRLLYRIWIDKKNFNYSKNPL